MIKKKSILNKTTANNLKTVPAANGASNPFAKLAALLLFIKQRRKDTRFPILRGILLLKYSIAFLILLAIAFSFFDQPFFDAHRADTIYGSKFFGVLTKLADSKWVLIFTSVTFISMGFISGDKFTGKLHAVWHRVFFTNWFIFYSIGMSGIIALLLKIIFGRSRPRYVNGDSAFDFAPFSSGYEFASFPSGHSTTAGALMVCLVLLMPRFKVLFIILGVVVASTRPLVGAHFPSDVLAGLALGAVFTWVYARSMAKDRLLFKFSKDGNLLLRNEGYGYCHKIPSMILQCFAGKKKSLSENK